MIDFNKELIKEKIKTEEIYEILLKFGGDPEYTTFGIISSTICHNPPHVGSRKLYYYNNSGLFHCFTGCAEPSFDIFELIIKIARIQWNLEYDLNKAIRYIANYFGIMGAQIEKIDEEEQQEWDIYNNYDRIKEIQLSNYNIALNYYDSTILDRFNYNVALYPWLKAGISQQVLQANRIGYYPGDEQITIPHFDINGNLVGLRGRTLVEENGKKYGKYRPLTANGIIYKHPLGANLYGIDKSKNDIQKSKTAIIFEGEKSVLLFQTYFPDFNIAVACCGSSVSAFQMNQLKQLGVNEVVIAFDRDFEDINDAKGKKILQNYKKLYERYHNEFKISFILDTNKITGLKSSPIDEGKEKFITLLNERRTM